jgi:hypothetical protein
MVRTAALVLPVCGRRFGIAAFCLAASGHRRFPPGQTASFDAARYQVRCPCSAPAGTAGPSRALPLCATRPDPVLRRLLRSLPSVAPPCSPGCCYCSPWEPSSPFLHRGRAHRGQRTARLDPGPAYCPTSAAAARLSADLGETATAANRSAADQHAAASFSGGTRLLLDDCLSKPAPRGGCPRLNDATIPGMKR